MTSKLSIFLLLTILVNITTGNISDDSVTTNSPPSQDLNKETTLATENFNDDNIAEGSTITEDESSTTPVSPPDVQTTVANENQYDSHVDDASNAETATMATESINESTTNQVECVCDCFANGNQVTVSCSTHSTEETQNETTENSSNIDSTLPSAKTTTPVLVEENSTNSKNTETTSDSNVEANVSTQSTVDNSQTTIVTPRPICTKPGVRAHELDCKQYYDCSLEESEDGNLHLITKTCPAKQAFNIELNRCSRDISSCPLDIQCLVKGTVADPIGNSSYYLCEPRLGGLGTFHVFHINCGSHEIYYPTFGKCFIDINDVPAFIWNEVKDIDIVKAELKLIKEQYKLKLKEEKDRKKAEKKLQKEAKKKAKLEAASFACVEEGNFASQINDTFYITCVVKKDKFKAYAMQCSLGETFDPEERVCIYKSTSVNSLISEEDISISGVKDDD